MLHHIILSCQLHAYSASTYNNNIGRREKKMKKNNADDDEDDDIMKIMK